MKNGGNLGQAQILGAWPHDPCRNATVYAADHFPLRPYVDKPIKPATYGQCDARLCLPIRGHHRPLAGTNLCCLVTEAHMCMCEQLVTWKRNGQESNPRPPCCKSNALTITPPRQRLRQPHSNITIGRRALVGCSGAVGTRWRHTLKVRSHSHQLRCVAVRHRASFCRVPLRTALQRIRCERTVSLMFAVPNVTPGSVPISRLPLHGTYDYDERLEKSQNLLRDGVPESAE